MIDLTPLEVRKKKGDFRRAMRGYDPALVDDFLDLVADRLEQLVRENLSLQERMGRQEEQVKDYRDRERALTEALVSAQEMREEVRRQATREAELSTRSAEQHAEQLRAKVEEEVRQMRSSAQQQVSQELAALQQERQREEEKLRHLRARQQEFLSTWRVFLEQELAELGVITRTAGATERVSGARKGAAAASGSADARPRHDAERPPAGARQPQAATAPVRGALPPDELDEDDVAAESALALGVSPAEAADLDEEAFAPEPFVDDESGAVVEAFEIEAEIPVEGAAPGVADETELAGDGAEARLYDAIAGDEDGDGVPGPIGLGPADTEPWTSTPEWSMPDLGLIGAADDGEDIDLDDEDDDEETLILLRNAAAAGYRLEDDPAKLADEPVPDELLLDEAVADAEKEPDTPVDDGWLPTLLEDEK